MHLEIRCREQEREGPLLVRVWPSSRSGMRAEVLLQPPESELWRRWLEGADWDWGKQLEEKHSQKEAERNIVWYH